VAITKLHLQGIRNLKSSRLELHPQVNLIVGDNASGKTSLLEGVHFLGLGRSFRTGQAAKVLTRGLGEFIVFAQVEGVAMGLRWLRSSGIEAKVKGVHASSLSELPLHLPLQLITPEAGVLVSGGPKERRAFIDWGVFHVEPQFHSVWKRYRRLLKQRNAAIRMKSSQQQVSIWDSEYIACSVKVAQFRQLYAESLVPIIEHYVEQFIPELKFSFELYQGWSADSDLKQQLINNFDRDMNLGFTQLGPHKCDFKIKTEGVSAAHHLSRGQQKLLVCALRIAQGIHLQQSVQTNNCVFLIDDFSSELDGRRQKLLADMLLKSGAQLFVTGISCDDLIYFQQDDFKTFHVEQGEIIEAKRAI